MKASLKTKTIVKPMEPEKKAAMLLKRQATKELKIALALKKRKRDEDDMRWYNGFYSSPY